mgnify:CR=1 FL=1
MNGAESIAQALVAHGVKRVYSHAGGTISRILDAIDRVGIQVVTAVNEAQAVHMAQGAYRASGRVQVALCTSGPGVTNAVTGIADAYYDQDAVMLLAGQVATHTKRGNRPVRQWGFQECQTLDIMRPVSKAVYVGVSATSLVELVNEALYVAMDPRPGPTVMECPMDLQEAIFVLHTPDKMLDEVQRRLLELAKYVPMNAVWSTQPPRIEGVAEVMAKLEAAERPVIIAGRGCLSAVDELRIFVEHYARVPVVTSMPAVGVIPTDGGQCFGMLGHTGTKQVNGAVAYADFVLVLGARLDIRQTGSMTDTWSAGKYVVVVDYDDNELHNKRVGVDRTFNCSVAEWLQEAMA